MLFFSFLGLQCYHVITFTCFRVSDFTMADLASVQEQLKELKEQQLVARESTREVEIKN